MSGRNGVTAIVVTFYSEAVVAECLRSLPAALEGTGASEVIVVDNASTDGTLAAARAAFPGVRILAQDDNLGYAAAINIGIRAAAPGHDILVLNPDIRLAPGSVAPLAAALDGGAGIAVPRLTDDAGRRRDSLRREPTAPGALVEGLLGGRAAARLGLGERIIATEAYRTGTEADWATGAAMLVDRGLLDDIGLLDESFFLYSEETDLMLRARDARRPTRYVDEAVAVHLGGDLTSSPRLWAMRSVNRLILHRRRHGRIPAAAFFVASLVGEGLRALLGRPTNRAAARTLVSRGPGIVMRAPAPPVPGLPGWICFSAQDWWYYNRAHSDFQLMQRIARHRDVLFVNSITLRMPLPGRTSNPGKAVVRKLRSIGRLVRRPLPDVPGFRVMTPLPFPWYGSERARRFNAWFVRTQVHLVARAVGIIGAGRIDPVISVTIPTAFPPAEGLPHSALVMNRSDKYSMFREANQDAIRAMEVHALASADRIFYCGQALMEDEAELCGDRALTLDHGVDVDLFRPLPPEAVPADLAAIAGPRIGFFGKLRDRLVDYELLARLAQAIPDASIVLIGPAEDSFDALASLPNVHYLGPRPHEDIPAYGNGFDVAVMPWRDNEWIRNSNPIKLKEYLALGLPVVSIDFPEVRRYDGVIRVASDPESFIAAVKQTLADGGLGTPEQRRATVSGSTWDRAARRFLHESERTSADPPRTTAAGEQGSDSAILGTP